MSIRLISSFLVLLLAVFYPAKAQPLIFSAAPEYNFGEKRTGEVVEHSFVLENRGNQLLRIHRVRSSCGCTVPKLSKEEILPGDSAEVTVRVDLAGRSGTQRQNVTLNTNDPQQPAFTLSVTGEAQPSIRIEPRTLNFQIVDPTALPSGVIRMESTTGRAFTIKKITTNNQRVDTKVVAAGDGLSAEVIVNPRAQQGEGHFTDVLIIETSEEDLASTRVLVMWQISKDVSVSPGQLSLVVPDKPQPISRFLMVRGTARLEKPLEVTSVEWPGRDVNVLISDTGEFGWRIEIKDMIPSADMHRQELLIHTNAKGFETLRVPVRVLQP